MYSNYRQSFLPQVATYPVAHVQSRLWPNMQQHEFHSEDEEYMPFFCRALYDYQAQDVSALSFRRGDIMQVLTQESSGWWDGLLRDERGWFPSHYVEAISEEEAEQASLSAESSAAETLRLQPVAISSMVDMSQAMIRQIDQIANEEWLKNEVLASSKRTATAIKYVKQSQMNDNWIPGVRPDGQIFYVNSKTGEHSRSIPRDGDKYSSDSHLMDLASMSPGTKVSLASGRSGSLKPMKHTQDIAGFGVPRRTATPWPWVRKLHDDGKSYFYYNQIDGRITWAWPEVSSNTSSQSSSSPPGQKAVNSSNTRLNVYSDNSDIHPRQPPTRGPVKNGVLSKPSYQMHTRPAALANTLPEYTTTERIAQSLQRIVAPPSPEGVIELGTAADSVIRTVLDNIRMNGLTRRPEEDLKLNDLIYQVVVVVRNLLYALAVPTLHISQHVLPQEVRDLPLPPQSPLKPAQRKLTATLSQLILSARAIQYDSGLSISDILSRIEVDAEVLRKDINGFIHQVQESKDGSKLSRHKHSKRLHGVFNTQNVGPGLVGAGAAGHWKGFGWVLLDRKQAASRRALGSEVISQLRQASNNLNAQIQSFLHVLQMPNRNSDIVVKQVRLSGRELVSQMSSIVKCISDIHVARHVDIDGLLQDGTGPYGRTIESAHWLVRKLEAVTQAVNDDTSVFLLTLQSVSEPDLLQYSKRRDRAWRQLISLASALAVNIYILLDTLDALFSLGHEQAEMSLDDYNGSIEWRMSRLSPLSTYDVEDDLVNMVTALRGVPTKPPKAHTPYDPSSNTSQTLGSSSEYDSTTNTSPSEDEQESKGIKNDETDPRFDDDRNEYTNKIAADFRPWYLRPNYSTEEILIDPDNTVKGGTLSALVERLTAHDQVDPSFNQAFLMTFKSFMTVNELFDLLVARFKIEPPPELKPDELEDWKKQKQQLVQLRVINTFIAMLKDDGILEKEDLYILERLVTFISSDEVSQVEATKKVWVYIERAARNDINALRVVMQGEPPSPLYPKTTKRLKITDIESLELARQLTLMESNLYQKIKAMECLQRAREQKAENMDNITNVIQMSNRIADWVAECVLSKEDARKRATIVKHLISVADHCRTLNNFSSMFAITSGLDTPPIRRLKRTWELVGQRSMTQFTACEMTIESTKSITKYRQLMSLVNPPCVPFIGVFLSALQFIHDGNPDMLPGGLVNFRKRQKAFEVITDIKRWQPQPFNLHPIPSVQTWIEESLGQFNDTKASSDQFWHWSIILEPREREDEKMARLLQESGFL
ncbi:hypothetical protein C0995_000158 [Termitomyces sp. Mi166|nr:hypothetical protein C0995_000158 [Termitomyces sp. Mi166\